MNSWLNLMNIVNLGEMLAREKKDSDSFIVNILQFIYVLIIINYLSRLLTTLYYIYKRILTNNHKHLSYTEYK